MTWQARLKTQHLVLQDLGFAQWYCWRFSYSGMLCCVNW